ncbi:MAG: hypothetical protein ACRC1H_13840, partial [Caldilineaceae bacterium]
PAAVAALVSGGPLALQGTYTTSVTNVIDLALIVPGAIVAGVLIWRRAALGLLFGALLYGILVMLAPLMTGQTIFQLRAGVELSMGAIVGILGVFGLLSLAGLVSLVFLLRGVRDLPTSAAVTSGRPSRPAPFAR